MTSMSFFACDAYGQWGVSNPESQDTSASTHDLFSSKASVPGELVPIPDLVSNENSTSEDLESIPD